MSEIFDQSRTITFQGCPSAPSVSPEYGARATTAAPPRGLASGTIAPAPRTSAATMHTSTTVASASDAKLNAILSAELFPGEPAQVGFARKERELGEAFAALPNLDQRALHTRFSNPKAGDSLAAKFGRLTAERRSRLLTFLADARRRAAQSKHVTK